MKTVIDVSEFNGIVSWKDVSADGVMIRAGYRGYGGGSIIADKMARANITGAAAAGLPIGLYFVTQAISESEAKEEADFCADMVGDIRLSLPVAWDTEPATADMTGRGDRIDRLTRTKCVLAFSDRCRERGLTPMLYCSTGWFRAQIDGENIRQGGTLIWLASYPSRPGGKNVSPSVPWDGWQYTDAAAANGVRGNCDVSWFREACFVGKYFMDTAGRWSEKSIDRCRDAGILNGKTENRFCPTDLLTREEAAAALDRMMCWVEKSIDERIKGEF